MMEQEVGDGTNFVIILAGELLKQAEDLVRKFYVYLFTILLGFRILNCSQLVFKKNQFGIFNKNNLQIMMSLGFFVF